MWKFKNKHTGHWRTYLLVGIPLFILAIASLWAFLSITVSAEVADDILRPVIGEKNTLALEAVFFTIQDKLDAGKYFLLGIKTGPIVRPAPLRMVTVNTVDQMELSTIQPEPGLSPLPGEGVWGPLTQDNYPDQDVIAKAFIRPDITHPYAVVSLVKMDMRKLGIGTEAGTYYPGGIHKIYGPGIVPKTTQASQTLLAVFNGGFQERDGHYGMIVGNRTYVPLKMNMPTLMLYTNGSLSFTTYTGQPFSSDVAALRQNGPYLIENGIITPYVEHGIDTWGRTITNSMYTWRSGLGITKEGNVIYAAGNSLIPQTLAKALQKAGAVNAIQLDINPPWVRFITYQSNGNGQYAFSPLVPSMQGGREYLRGYSKDFFYIYRK